MAKKMKKRDLKKIIKMINRHEEKFSIVKMLEKINNTLKKRNLK